MPFDKFFDIDSINEERRKAVAKSIRTISTEEFKKLGEEIFDSPDHPWREKFFQLIAQKPAAPVFQAHAGEGGIFFYDPDQENRLWGLPKSGRGPLSVKGRQIIEETNARGP